MVFVIAALSGFNSVNVVADCIDVFRSWAFVGVKAAISGFNSVNVVAHGIDVFRSGAFVGVKATISGVNRENIGEKLIEFSEHINALNDDGKVGHV